MVPGILIVVVLIVLCGVGYAHINSTFDGFRSRIRELEEDVRDLEKRFSR